MSEDPIVTVNVVEGEPVFDKTYLCKDLISMVDAIFGVDSEVEPIEG